MPVLDPVDVGLMDDKDLEKSIQRRLLGRFGADAPALVKSALPGELEIIPGTQTLWAELRWAARAEGVVHLDDLLMRRVRLGVLLQGGGEDIMPAVKTICQTELGWDDARWLVEEASYLRLWQDKYSLPNIDLIPDWKEQLRKAETERLEVRSKQRKRLVVSSALMVGITTAVVGFVILLIWRKKQDR
jgi:glycerol-3-phosphate dehydrogenase